MKPMFVFSGQGAQFVGMGKDLYDNFPEAKTIFDSADRILGASIKDICFNGPEDALTQTVNCQPAIYTMSMACLEVFRARFPEVKPVGVAGLSLGEYAALACADVFSFEDGLKLLRQRAQFMDEACHETQGAMASVLGGDNAVIAEVCAECGIDVANYNCPGQTVISGEKTKVEAAVAALIAKGMKKVIPLTVAGAFHSRLMASAGIKLTPVLAQMNLNAPTCAVAQNYTGALVSDTNEIKHNLVEQVAGSVRWEDCVRSFIAMGADTIIEFGPGAVLTGLMKRTDGAIQRVNIGKLEDLNNFQCS